MEGLVDSAHLERDDAGCAGHVAQTTDLSVVIVNWNTADLLDACIGSVRAAAPHAEIIVVDNGSTDGSLERLAQYPDVTVLTNAENLGYQTACNQGTRASRHPNVLHINTDALMQPGTLDGLLRVLDDRSDVGIVAPRLEYGDGSFQRWTAGNLPTLRSLAVSFLLADRFGSAGHGIWIDADRAEPMSVGWVSSACLLLRRSVYDEVGGLDERFFAYMDDVDLCAAAGRHGWTVWYEPTVTAIHLMGGSQIHPGSAASPRAIRALGAWFRLERGLVAAACAAVVMTTGFTLRAAAHLLVAPHRRDARRAARQHLQHARVASTAGRTP